MGFRSVVASVAVRDLEAARNWYAKFLDSEATRIPMPNDVEWDFSGSTLQVFADAERAGKSTITLEPEDLQAELARLASMGLQSSETNSGVFEVAIFADPDGNQIVLAKPVD